MNNVTVSHKASSRPCPFGANTEIIIKGPVARCALASAIPRMGRGASIEIEAQERQRRLQEAGCPKWKLRAGGFWIFKRFVGEDCVYADGLPHLE